MDERPYHIIWMGDEWSLRRYNARRAYGYFATQDSAVDHGRRLSKKYKVELVIHGINGTVDHKEDYRRK